MTTTTDTKLTRAEAAYAHLASFQRGDTVDVGGRGFFLRGTVAVPQKRDFGDFPGAVGLNGAYVIVTGDATVPGGTGNWRTEPIDVKVTVASLLSGKHTIASVADAKAGRTPYFDAATWAMQNPES
jgi:hypothetical protein